MSDNPKAKNADKQATSEAKEKQEVDFTKIAKVPSKEVELSFGTYTVKDLSVPSLMVLLGQCLDIFVAVSESDEELDPLVLLAAVSRMPGFKEKIATFFALCCGEEEPTLFLELNLEDFKILFPAIKEVVDFEEIRKTFLEAGLLSLLNPTSSE